MIYVLMAVLGIHWLLFVVDEFAFHRKHGVSPRERWSHPLDLLLCGTLAGYAVVFPYGESPQLPFMILLPVALFSITKDEFLHAARCSGAEQWVHAMRYIFHPLALLLVAVLWPLMQGVNFVIGAVLPFDTAALRPMVAVYAGLCVILGVFSFVRKAPLAVQKKAADAKAPGTSTVSDASTKQQPAAG